MTKAVCLAKLSVLITVLKLNQTAMKQGCTLSLRLVGINGNALGYERWSENSDDNINIYAISSSGEITSNVKLMTRASFPSLKKLHQAAHVASFILQRFAGRSAFFHHCRVLLRYHFDGFYCRMHRLDTLTLLRRGI